MLGEPPSDLAPLTLGLFESLDFLLNRELLHKDFSLLDIWRQSSRKPEVTEADIEIIVDKDVSGLDVSVHQPGLVDELEAAEQAVQDLLDCHLCIIDLLGII